MRSIGSFSCLSLLAFFASCAGHDTSDATPGGDLALGDRSADDVKADGEGDWGSALDCKPVPVLPQLVHPRITLSIDGLTLHLTDDSGYDKVFPVGPGAIDTTETDAEFGESRSYYPIIHYGKHDFEITPATIQECKTWWTDAETGAKAPVFAGLPFLSWSGNFAIHGPIDNYRAPNGGNLRRGYVSHGCFRMEAADVLEVYGRIKGVAHVPVHVQREPERRADGSRVDLAAKWVGAACSANTDCNFPNGFCEQDAYAQHGFCSARCTQYCADKPGAPPTFCVADPQAPGKGMCVPKAIGQDQDCRPYDALTIAPATPRLNQPTVTADVCLPGSHGWVGDHCFADPDCGNGTTCLGAHGTAPGVCSMACDKYCADEPGEADTFCAAVPALSSAGACLRQCTPSSNASECPTDMVCGAAPRNGQSSVTKTVCLPR